jgi:RimJ/RimL family protein N-acetyltransferase
VASSVSTGGNGQDLLADGKRIRTARLVVRPVLDDAEAAFSILGAGDGPARPAPARESVRSIAHIRGRLGRWMVESGSVEPYHGRWAVVRAESGEVIGGVTLSPMPPDDVDLQVGWHISPKVRGNGFAAEAGHAVAHRAFDAGVDEVFAVVRPHNVNGAATARGIGMEWVGITEKYYGCTLHVYRLRRSDLDVPALNVLKRRQELLPSLGWAGPMGMPLLCPGPGILLEHPATAPGP